MSYLKRDRDVLDRAIAKVNGGEYAPRVPRRMGMKKNPEHSKFYIPAQHDRSETHFGSLRVAIAAARELYREGYDASVRRRGGGTVWTPEHDAGEDA